MVERKESRGKEVPERGELWVKGSKKGLKKWERGGEREGGKEKSRERVKEGWLMMRTE